MEWLWSIVDAKGLLNTFIGAVAVLIFQWVTRLYIESRGPYTGLWETRIFDENGNIVKVDHVSLRQRGKLVRASIQRVFPRDQRHRQYLAKGRIDGRDFYAIFWPRNDRILSFGSWLVHQVNDGLFKGFYLRLDETAEKTEKRVAQFRLEIARDIMWKRNGKKKRGSTLQT